MKKTFVLLLLMALAVSFLAAEQILLTFRDTSEVTKGYIRQINPDYPQPTPVDGSFARFKYRVYMSLDDVIDPLDANGNPTGDDIWISNVGNEGSLNIAPSGGVTFNAPALICPAPVEEMHPSIAYHSSGHKIYYRIFNSHSVKTATKYLVAHQLFTVPETTTFVVYVPEYAWDKAGWIEIAPKEKK